VGPTAFRADESLLRDIYGGLLTGYQARLSFRFAGRWSVFAGYRSLRAEGTPYVVGVEFDAPAGRLDMAMNSWRGGFQYDLPVGRWTFAFAAGLASTLCRETWPEAGLSAERTVVGAVFAAGADLRLVGPLGLFARLELGPTERKDDILLGGLDAVGGLSLRF
jgi:8-oxo-dGTP pyrophosphatase MutT (NUDIX family)